MLLLWRLRDQQNPRPQTLLCPRDGTATAKQPFSVRQTVREPFDSESRPFACRRLDSSSVVFCQRTSIRSPNSEDPPPVSTFRCWTVCSLFLSILVAGEIIFSRHPKKETSVAAHCHQKGTVLFPGIECSILLLSGWKRTRILSCFSVRDRFTRSLNLVLSFSPNFKKVTLTRHMPRLQSDRRKRETGHPTRDSFTSYVARWPGLPFSYPDLCCCCVFCQIIVAFMLSLCFRSLI